MITLLLLTKTSPHSHYCLILISFDVINKKKRYIVLHSYQPSQSYSQHEGLSPREISTWFFFFQLILHFFKSELDLFHNSILLIMANTKQKKERERRRLHQWAFLATTIFCMCLFNLYFSFLVAVGSSCRAKRWFMRHHNHPPGAAKLSFYDWSSDCHELWWEHYHQ